MYKIDVETGIVSSYKQPEAIDVVTLTCYGPKDDITLVNGTCPLIYTDLEQLKMEEKKNLLRDISQMIKEGGTVVIRKLAVVDQS
jgi:hypothetical protein